MKQSIPTISIPGSTRALIFDCDGTLVDSMPQHMKAWELAFSQFGQPYRKEFLNSYRGHEETDIVDMYNRTFATELDSAQVVQQKHRYLRELIPSVQPFQPVADLVHRYHNQLPMAVVSGGTQTNVHLALETIGLLGHFKVILTADDPLPPKPAPDLFLAAAMKLAVSPAKCLVFEDGDAGLEGAKKAGMAVIDVRIYSGD
jgi:HAD superfamily hydrolase (TIGR01509 family)